MKYRLIWLKYADNQLLKFYLAAREAGVDSMAITKASREIDDQLRAAPETSGESREPPTRVLIVDPLTVEFEVHEEEGVVVVTEVRYVPPCS